MASPIVRHVVVDAGGFIRNAPIRDIGENVYTIPEVISESCDKETRKRLQVLPYTIHFKQPSAEDVVFDDQLRYKFNLEAYRNETALKDIQRRESYVSEFAKKTGDYHHLSATDIRVLALTYMLEKEQVGVEHIKKHPDLKPTKYIVPNKAAERTDIAGFYLPEQKSNSTAAILEDREEKEEEDEEEEDDDEEEEDDDDDDEGWITPSNIKSVMRQMGGGYEETEERQVAVACLTTDFAMQNVLIHMGLNVISVDGMLIKRASSYVLRCTACFKITYQMEKVFCSYCGNKTLKRVAMTREEDGTIRYFFSKRPLSLKGKKYPLPMPKGGKHSNNPILCEDQPMPQQRMPRKAQEKVDIFSPDFVEGSSPFALNDVTSRAARIGISGKHDFRRGAYWNKRNPNEPRKYYGKKESK